jgi:hypothetical protein
MAQVRFAGVSSLALARALDAQRETGTPSLLKATPRWNRRAMQLAFASAIAIGTASGFTAPAKAQNWVGGASGNWTVGTNWSGGVEPNSATAVVRIDNGNLGQATVVTLNAYRSVGSLFIDSGDQLNIANNTGLTFNGGTFSNAGTVNLLSAGNGTYLFINGATDTTFTGGGRVVMGSNAQNFIYSQNGRKLTNAADHTIEGGGQLGINALRFENQGMVDANINGVEMSVDMTDNFTDFVNTGTLRASNGGVLRLLNSALTNTGGTVSALNGGFVRLQGTTIRGGTLSASLGGVFQTVGGTGASLDNVTISSGSVFQVVNNSTLFVANTITNNGRIELNSAGNFTGMLLTGDNNAATTADDVILAGNGKLVLGGNSQNYVYSSGSANRLINSATHTIEGGGSFGNNSMIFVNRGTVNANDGLLFIDMNDPATDFVNTGTIKSSAGGTLRIVNSNLNNFQGVTNGLLLADNSIVQIQNSTIIGGTLQSQGAGGAFETFGGGAGLQNTTLAAGAIFRTVNNTNTSLSGTITNNGRIELNSVGNGTGLLINGDNNLATTADDVTLTGNGKVVLGGNSQNLIYGNGAGQRLINDTSHTIEGGGQIGLNNLAFVNKGLVHANNGLLQMDLNDPFADFVNTGTMKASGTGILRLTNSNLSGTGTLIADNASVQLQGSTIRGNTLTGIGTGVFEAIGSGGGLDNVTISANTLYRVNNNTGTFLYNTITNNGEMRLASVGNNSAFLIRGDNDFDTTADDVILTGSGKLVLGGNSQNLIYADQNINNRLVNAAGHTIEGGGQIGINSLTFVNNGLVNANNGLLTFDLPDQAKHFVNNATMKASTGGILRISNSALQNNGVLLADDAAVQLANATIIGGTLTSTGNGVIETISNATFDGVTISNGSIHRNNNNTFTELKGTITNNGQLQLNSGGNGTAYLIRGDNLLATTGDDVILQGTGKLVMGGNSQNLLYSDGGQNNRLINSAGHTIEGGGTIGLNSLALMNNGLINANNGTLLIDMPDTAAHFINNNVIKASSGGLLRIQNSVLQNNGTLLADNAQVQLLGGTTIIGGNLTSTGANGVIENMGAAFLDSVTVTTNSIYRNNNNTSAELKGTIVNNGRMELNSGGNSTIFFVTGDADLATTADDVILSGNGKLVLGSNTANRIYSGNSANNRLINDVNHTIEGGGTLGLNNLLTMTNRGLVNANNGEMTSTIGGGTFLNEATGILQASGSGNYTINGNAPLNNLGTVQALDGRTLTIASPTVVQNNTGNGTLKGGTWKAIGNGSTVSMNGNPIGTLSEGADVTLSGFGSLIRTTTGGNQSFDSTLHTVAANSALRVLNNRDFIVVANGGNYSNSGKTQLGGGTFKGNTSFTNTATGEVYGFGTITNTIVNSGLVRAAGGALSVTRVDGQSGTVQVDAGASLTLEQASDADFLVHNGTSLSLGGAFTVTNDYTNAAFGTGNSFNARANVTGSAINAVAGTSQTITGANVTNGTTTTPTLNLGNVRVGQSVVSSYNVNNVSTNDTVVLRGAIQTAAGGGSITDSRLSGAGVTAQNFTLNPDASQNYGVTFNATTSGALTNQKVAVVNNFDNVAEQVISITGTAWDSAQGDLKPGSINLGNYRVGQNATFNGNLNVENLTTGAFAEKLGIANVNATGIAGLSANNALGATRVNPGATANNAVTVALNTTGLGKGVQNGSVSAQFLTDGAGTSGLAVANTNLDNTSVSATGYALANPSVQANLAFGNVLKDSLQERFITVTNTGTLGDQFQEAMNARFKNVPLPSGIAALSGQINLLAAGASNNNTLKVRLNTSSTGNVTATVLVEVESDGTGTSGLGVFALGDRQVQVLGTVEMDGIVGDRAIGQVAPTVVNFGAKREGQAASQVLTISNVQNGPREGLNASFTGASGAITTAGGPITGLGYTTETVLTPAVDNSTMSVGLNTSNAVAFGNRSGTVTIDFKSNGEFDGGTVFDIADGTVEVQGTVYQKAKAGPVGDVNLGSFRVGAGVQSANVAISNTASATGGFTEDLGVALDGATGGIGFTNVAGGKVGAASSKNAQVSANFDTAGVKNGTVTLNFTTEEVNGSGLGSEGIGQASFNVTGKAYQTASANVTGSLDFGVMRKNADPAAKAVNVANTATGALVDQLKATASGGPSGLIILNPASIQVASGNNGNLNFDLNTATSGVIDGNVNLALASSNADMADLDLGTQQLAVKATITEAAKAKVQAVGGAATLSGGGTSYTVNFGTVNADTGIKSFDLSILNDIVASAFSENLGGSFALNAGDFTFTGASTFSGLMGGAAHALSVSFDTAGRAAGQFLGNLVFSGFSRFAGLSDLALGDITIAIRATIAGEPGEVSEPGTLLLLTGGGLLLWRLRKKQAKQTKLAA